MGDFKKLAVWGKAHTLTLRLYSATSRFPKSEMFGLVSQIRRAAASVGANVAEGCGRQRDTELGRFLSIAIGSASELEYHLILARDLGFLTTENYLSLQHDLNEIGRMLVALNDRVRGRKVIQNEELIVAE